MFLQCRNKCNPQKLMKSNKHSPPNKGVLLGKNAKNNNSRATTIQQVRVDVVVFIYIVKL